MESVNLEKKVKIIELSQPMSQRKMSMEFGISRHAVQVTKKKCAGFGNVSDRKKTGRPSKLDKKKETKEI